MVSPFNLAWNLLKALPEQQGFVPAYSPVNIADSDYYRHGVAQANSPSTSLIEASELGDPLGSSGFSEPQSTGTLHPAVLGMLARQKRDEIENANIDAIYGVGGEPRDAQGRPLTEYNETYEDRYGGMKPINYPGEKFGSEELWEQYGERPNTNLATGPLSEAPVFTSKYNDTGPNPENLPYLYPNTNFDEKYLANPYESPR